MINFVNIINNMNIGVPHIVQYQGSKRILAPQILNFLPHRFNRLIEPFAGMAAITIAVAKQKRTQSFIINDINSPLIKVLRSAIETPNELIEKYSVVWNMQFVYPQGSVEHYYKIREDFNNGDQSAENMLYLLARCVKGAVRYGSNGLFNQSPDKRRNGTSPITLRKNVIEISSILKGKALFYSKDYQEILNMATCGDIVYLDPPYQGVCSTRDNRYFSGIKYDDFVCAIDKLNQRNIDFVISYDGKCGDKTYGNDLPRDLNLKKVLLKAGLSSQSLLLGKKETTFESLYISRGLSQNVIVPPQQQTFDFLQT